jgi:hypothetical protein
LRPANAENGLVLGEGQVTSGPRGNFLGEWQGEIETESGGQTVNACGNEPHCARLTVQPTDTGLRVGYCNSVESQCAGSALAQTCALLLDATPTGNGFTGVGVNNNPPCCIGCVGQNRVYGCAITATHTIDAFGQETLTGTLGGGVTFCPPEGTADVVTHFTFCRPNPCPVAPPPPPGGD